MMKLNYAFVSFGSSSNLIKITYLSPLLICHSLIWVIFLFLLLVLHKLWSDFIR